jgi:hypothetical protein
MTRIEQRTPLKTAHPTPPSLGFALNKSLRASLFQSWLADFFTKNTACAGANDRLELPLRGLQALPPSAPTGICFLAKGIAFRLNSDIGKKVPPINWEPNRIVTTLRAENR